MAKLYLLFPFTCYVWSLQYLTTTAFVQTEYPRSLRAARSLSFAQPEFFKAIRIARSLLAFSDSTDVSQDQREKENSVCDPSTISYRVFKNDQRPVILFDGVCNLCNSAVNLALDWDPNGKLRFSALQSNVGRGLLQANGRDADDISSIVLVTNDGAYVKSDAILKITEELTPLGEFFPIKPAAQLGQFLIPAFLRDLIYDGVANNRYSILGKRNSCRFDADGEFEDRFVDDDIALQL